MSIILCNVAGKVEITGFIIIYALIGFPFMAGTWELAWELVHAHHFADWSAVNEIVMKMIAVEVSFCISILLFALIFKPASLAAPRGKPDRESKVPCHLSVTTYIPGYCRVYRHECS